jgi:hypothetical protein
MSVKTFRGSYIIDGTTFTQLLSVEIESISSTGDYHGRTNLNGKLVASKGNWKHPIFHNYWQDGSFNGRYALDTNLSSSRQTRIIGTIRIGIKTGLFVLDIGSAGSEWSTLD